MLTLGLNHATFLYVKLLKVLLNSLISGLFFSGLLALLILNLNINLEFRYALLGQLILFHSISYGLLVAAACILIFFISQFVSGGFKIKMKKKERNYLESVFEDCEKLEKENKLTEYGAGQGNLCIVLLKKNRKNF